MRNELAAILLHQQTIFFRWRRHSKKKINVLQRSTTTASAPSLLSLISVSSLCQQMQSYIHSSLPMGEIVYTFSNISTPTNITQNPTADLVLSILDIILAGFSLSQIVIYACLIVLLLVFVKNVFNVLALSRIILTLSTIAALVLYSFEFFFLASNVGFSF